MRTTAEKILAEIRAHGRNWAFTGKDFLGMASRRAIDTALHRLLGRGKIRRIARGLYDRPRFSKLLNKETSPDVDQVAQAIARKHGWRMQATGAMAANLLGLSTQVPAKVIYLIDGPGKTIKIGNTTIRFRKAAPKDLNVQNAKSALVIQALKFLGRKSLDQRMISRIRSKLSKADRRKLLHDARYGTDWIYEMIEQICKEGGK